MCMLTETVRSASSAARIILSYSRLRPVSRTPSMENACRTSCRTSAKYRSLCQHPVRYASVSPRTAGSNTYGFLSA